MRGYTHLTRYVASHLINIAAAVYTGTRKRSVCHTRHYEITL